MVMKLDEECRIRERAAWVMGKACAEFEVGKQHAMLEELMEC